MRFFVLKEDQCMYPSSSEALKEECGYQFLITLDRIDTSSPLPFKSPGGAAGRRLRTTSIPSSPPAEGLPQDFWDSRVRDSTWISISLHWNPAHTYVNPGVLWFILSSTRGPQVHQHTCKPRQQLCWLAEPRLCIVAFSHLLEQHEKLPLAYFKCVTATAS